MRHTTLLQLATLSAGAILALSGCGGSGSSSPCSGVTGTCVAFSAGATESAIDNAFVTATAGTTIAFGPGTFAFTNTLSIGVANFTVKGAGMGLTIFDFSGQTAGADGIDAILSTNTLLFTGFTIQNTKGDAIKVLKADAVTFRDVKVIWTAADSTTHGAYGLYPVTCTNVMIDSNDVEGASDSGIYVGQSNMIIVKNNTVMKNVAGIEIENSFNADVMNNTATANTGGILVFDLPGLPQEGGHNVRVFNNIITSNNTENFAAVGDIVSLVPAGTGSFVMANHLVEVFGNTFTGNNTAAFSVVSYFVTQQTITDANYEPIPYSVYAHDNTFSGNGGSPDVMNQLGLLLGSVKSDFSAMVIPDLIYDGIPSTSTAIATGPSTDPMLICFGTNAATDTFVNLNFEDLNSSGSNEGAVMTTDVTNYACAGTTLPAVTVTAP